MLRRIRLGTFLCGALGVAVILGLAGCSPEQYKAQADKEVYQIIDNKWRDEFGRKSNYIISDSNVPPPPDDVRIERAVPASGVINLAQAAMLPRHITGLSKSEEKFNKIADLCLSDTSSHGNSLELLMPGTATIVKTKKLTRRGVGFRQLLADGAQISIDIAMDWTRFLTGDPRTSLASILSAEASQPLLRGRGRQVVQENLTQAERDVLYQIRFNRYRKDLVSIANDYRVLT
jgi:hypothetical protein